MNFGNFIGQTIDGKYRIERQLGKGGMGTVYLATHLGTERPVAVKLIAPQFMERAEFVERFRREARAAGRLRHPNVVDVTDFGIAETRQGRLAYLVMEYLDGCTLGEILEEEKQLPLSWSLDILEQVCSAVHAAHEQGIIHRDLKPDNIWLEPNQRGGYTVKVLDFGIAKLEEHHHDAGGEDIHISVLPTIGINFGETVSDGAPTATRADAQGGTLVSEKGTAVFNAEAGTLVQTESDFSEQGTAVMNAGALDREKGTAILAPDELDLEKGTAIMPPAEVDLESGTAILPNKQTQIIAAEDGTRFVAAMAETDRAVKKHTAAQQADLTRVGAVLGTPLYMSPEQCRGERLTARSDIYSLGVIAYQMLAGKTPFEGDFTSVMQAHRETPPPPLAAKQVPRKIKKVINSALAKDPELRPPTAEALATKMRAQSEGIWALLRRSLIIYSEHLPKFVALTAILSLPVVFFNVALIVVSFLKVSDVLSDDWASILTYSAGSMLGIASIFCTYLILGTTTWIVAQFLAVPLRPIRLRPAFAAARRKWKRFAGTGILNTVLTFVFGILSCGIGFLVTSVIWTLVAPVVMMENVRGWQALKRSTQLVRRSVLTATAVVLLMVIIPATVSGFISFVVNVTARAFDKESNSTEVTRQLNDDENPARELNLEKNEKGIRFSFGEASKAKVTTDDGGKANDMRSRLKHTVLETLIQIFWLPMHIFVTSFSSIIIALLYLKTRQAGGESMQDLLGQFEDVEQPKSKWQQRVQDRLVQSGRITSKT